MDFNISLPCSGSSVGPATQLFTLFIQSIVKLQCEISSSSIWPRDYGLTLETEELPKYDFIVIGAGSAGSVVANRLSENSHNNVLVLEAGGDPPIDSEIPSLAYSLIHTKYDWGYYAKKSDFAGLSTPLGIYWPRGKFLGGSSGMNYMVYMRGNNEDYDNWERLGNPGWGWKDVLYYFKKSEDNQNPAFIGRYHACGGLLKVDRFSYTDPFTNIFRIASKELGYQQVDDLTDGTFVGHTYCQSTQYKGLRWSAAKAFLSSAKNRKNLHVIKHAYVSKINFNDKNEVESVNFVRNGKKEYTVQVEKEVILSAGAINSPQLLMLSGIGPRKHLRKKGIEVIKNLPVGLNLQDHLVVPLLLTLHKSTSKKVSDDELLQQIFQYSLYHTGPLSGGINFIGMIDSTGKNTSIPDVQVYYSTFPKQFTDIVLFPFFRELDELIVNQIAAQNQLYDIGVILISLHRPESVGKIKLRSIRYDDKPKIYPNYLTKKYDIDTLVRGVKSQIKFANTNELKVNEAEFIHLRIPQCDDIQYDSDKYWECYIRHLATTIYHPVGTVKMGPENDFTSVVNSRLQVKGVKKLRVADASIMPKIVSGNTNAPCMMIGEKAADFVKEDYFKTN